MGTATTDGEPLSEDWCAHRFDHASPALADNLHETLTGMRDRHPVTYSEEHGGFWVVTRYEDVLKVAQDWRTFSSAQGVSVPDTAMVVKPLPEVLDPPLHREYRRIINPYFTPSAVAGHEAATRELVTRLIDEVIEVGECDFMADFARPLPGLSFFELILNAPSDQVVELADLAAEATKPANPGARKAWEGMFAWITEFLDQRRRQEPRGDVVDAVLGAEIDGEPLSREDIIGVVQLLILGGLETTAGALGQFMIRFCHDPEIPALLRRHPERIADAVEELLRIDPPFISIARTATCDTELGGKSIKAGDKVLIYWASANRDPGEFSCPAAFDLDRSSNRHLGFGAGPHRCAGSNLARMNLRVALEELVERFDDLRLRDGAEPIPFHSALNRAPIRVPITFATGPRRGTAEPGRV